MMSTETKRPRVNSGNHLVMRTQPSQQVIQASSAKTRYENDSGCSLLKTSSSGGIIPEPYISKPWDQPWDRLLRFADNSPGFWGKI